MGEIQALGSGPLSRHRGAWTAASMFVWCLLVRGNGGTAYSQTDTIPQRGSRANAFRVRIVGTTNTQALLAYTAPDSNPCTVEVSESNTYFPLVHDVNAALFAGADSDARSTSVNSGTSRMVVVGARLSQAALDGNVYSRALQAYTTHYYRVACNGTGATGSFTTANIALGNTYTEVSQVDPSTGTPVVPTFPTDRTTTVIDPKTGALVKNLYIPSDSPNVPTPADSGTGRLCGYQLAHAPDGTQGFLCAFPNAEGGPGYLYYIIPSTGETRFLGELWIGSGPNWPQGGSTALPYPSIDSSNPLLIYCSVNDNEGNNVLLKATYTGTFSDQPSRAHASMSWVNMTPEPTSMQGLLHSFNPAFDPTKYHCSAGGGGAKYLLMTCLRGIQDSYGWVAVLDKGNGLPIGNCGTDPKLCPHIISAFNTVSGGTDNPIHGGCGIHSSTLVSSVPPNDIPLAIIITHGLTGNGSLSSIGIGTGPYLTTTTARLPNNGTTLAVAGDPLSDDPMEPFLKHLEPGDMLVIGARDNITGNNIEFLKVTGITSANLLQVQRAFARPLNNPAQAWPAGSTVMLMCGSESSAGYPWAWWKFTEDPAGANSSAVAETYQVGGHQDISNSLRVMEPYTGVAGSIMNNINVPFSWGMSSDVQFAGVSGWCNGSACSHYPSYQQELAPEQEQQWFLDMPTFNGGDAYAGPGGSTLISGQLYKFRISDRSIGGVLHRKQLDTITASGGFQFNDISGPDSVIGDTTAYSYKYCVANVAGECRPRSAPGDVYMNAPNITDLGCASGDFPSPNSHDLCLGDNATINQSLWQFGFVDNDPSGSPGIPAGIHGIGAGYSRRLSTGFAGVRHLGRVAKPLPDASWIYFDVGSPPGSAAFVMLKTPPFVKSDSVDRTTFVRAPISITTPQGQGIATATVEFGYLEQGTVAQHYCTSRREVCVAVASTVTDAAPFSYAQTETYTRMPCERSCTITLPVLPAHVAYYQVKFYDAQGAVVGLGYRGVSVEAAAAPAKVGGVPANAFQ
jgi:hypothetical protein